MQRSATERLPDGMEKTVQMTFHETFETVKGTFPEETGLDYDKNQN